MVPSPYSGTLRDKQHVCNAYMSHCSSLDDDDDPMDEHSLLETQRDVPSEISTSETISANDITKLERLESATKIFQERECPNSTVGAMLSASMDSSVIVLSSVCSQWDSEFSTLARGDSAEMLYHVVPWKEANVDVCDTCPRKVHFGTNESITLAKSNQEVRKRSKSGQRKKRGTERSPTSSTASKQSWRSCDSPKSPSAHATYPDEFEEIPDEVH